MDVRSHAERENEEGEAWEQEREYVPDIECSNQERASAFDRMIITARKYHATVLGIDPKETFMLRTLLLASAASAVFRVAAWADDRPPLSPPPPAIGNLKRAAMPLQRVLKNPDDMKILSAFLNDADQEVVMLNDYYGDTAGAERRLKEFEAEAAQITPTTEDAKKKLEQAKTNIRYLERRISAATVPDLEAKLTAGPDDLELYRQWAGKVAGEIEAEANRDPNRAQTMNEAAQNFAAKQAEKTQNAAVQRDIKAFLGFLSRSREQQIETGRKLVALLGSPAPPLQVSAWVNSEPLTLAELQGKVVLLDFWVLAPNRIGSVPDVLNWHARYADKGLIIIAVTSNYFAQWDAEEHRLTWPGDFTVGLTRFKPLTAEQEKDTLTALAKYHKLNYPLASWTTRDALDSPYNFGKVRSGLIVIDRQGKIRMIRAVPRARDALDVDKLLAELLASPSSK